MARTIGGLSDIKTGQKAKVHSKPRLEGAEYLDIYLMIKERQRLERYKAVINKSNERTDEELEFIRKGIEKLERSILPGAKEVERQKNTEKHISKKPLKVMVVDY